MAEKPMPRQLGLLLPHEARRLEESLRRQFLEQQAEMLRLSNVKKAAGTLAIASQSHEQLILES